MGYRVEPVRNVMAARAGAFVMMVLIRTLTVAAVLACGGGMALAQTQNPGTSTPRLDLPQILEQLGRQPTQPLSTRDADAGLRAALNQGVEMAVTRLGRNDGFFANPEVKIPLPGRLASLQGQLRPIGLSGPLDDVQLRLNRAAEAAMPEARRLFLDAVRTMTVADAVSIVRGPQDAGTSYLRGRTATSLTTLVRPLMERALTSSGAFSALDRAARRNGLGGEVPRLREDMTVFATQKALDGAFLMIAREEAAIRQDPARRTSDLLRRVFGGR